MLLPHEARLCTIKIDLVTFARLGLSSFGGLLLSVFIGSHKVLSLFPVARYFWGGGVVTFRGARNFQGLLFKEGVTFRWAATIRGGCVVTFATLR